MNQSTLDYENNSYISISTSETPTNLLKTLNEKLKPIKINYLEKVGELKDEYLFQILSIPTKTLLNDSIQLSKINQGLLSIKEIHQFSILQLPFQRSKRFLVEDPPVSEQSRSPV